MSLYLINSRHLLCVFQQMLKMPFHEVADSNILDFSLLLHLYQGPPTLQSDLGIFRVINFEFTYSWPMDKKKIKIFTIQFLYDSETCGFGLLIALLCRCYFTGNVELVSVDVEFFEYLRDFQLVFVNTGCVNMPISQFQGSL